jgi:uncharacterized membrane protein YbhN (UPF0104 family)
MKVRHHLKRIVVTVVKYGISLAILAWLFWKASHDDAFADLYDQPKNWWLLGAGLLVCLIGVTSTIVRWWLLVRALHMPFTLPDALRLGFVGVLFSFLTLGVLGGDLVKTIFLARKQPKRRTEAVASTVIDRIIGLYALFVLASIAILCIDWNQLHVRDPQQLAAVRMLCGVTLAATVACTIGIFVVALPSFGRSPDRLDPAARHHCGAHLSRSAAADGPGRFGERRHARPVCRERVSHRTRLAGRGAVAGIALCDCQHCQRSEYVAAAGRHWRF